MAQGPGAQSAGERGVAASRVDGPVITGDGSVSAGGHVIFAEKGATVVIGEAPVTMTAIARESALGRYLQHIISRNRYLQLQGVRSGGRLVHIELDQIYVTLRATRQRLVQVEEDWLTTETAPPVPSEAGRLRQQAGPVLETAIVSVDEALAGHSRLVVLGDPGSGKTTLLRYLALLYARDLAEGTALVQTRLEQTAPTDGLGNENGRLPILLPLRQIGSFLHIHSPAEDGTEGHALVLDFLLRSLQNERIELPDDFFDEWLTQGRAVILLDGLDEVADPNLRRRVSRLVEAFTCAYPACRFVVTSRIVGYSGPARLGEDYATTTICDFTLTDVEHFLSDWHRLVAIGQMGPGDSAEAFAAGQTHLLLAAIQNNERIRELTINPLMLTVIAMVYRDRVKLPDRRAELYAEAVDVLLGKWEEAKGLAEIPVIEGQPFDTGDRRLMLQSLALQMHECQRKEIGSGDLRSWLGEMFRPLVTNWREVERAVDRFLTVIEERTGLLVARGEGVYAFSHLTFQEYLAARAVAARDDYVAYTLTRAPDPWWREVILLEAGYLSLQSQERTACLVRAIADAKQEPEPYHSLVLAAECLRDIGGKRVQGNLEAEVNRRLRADLEADLRQEIDRRKIRSGWGRFRRQVRGENVFEERDLVRQLLERRAVVTQALARAGAGFWKTPYGEPEWVQIADGEFWIGEEGSQDEKLAHRLYLDEFWIARVPVTNAQYAFFVEAAGCEPPRDWEEGRPPKGKEAHPVVYVSWYDALAYCHWLGEMTGQQVALPSEVEWEKAARGGRDWRAYPWGEAFDAIRCNCQELGLGATTPVGVFPEGASPYGVLDMSGNVWEWTRSNLRDQPYHPRNGEEKLDNSDYRVLRGGAFLSDQNYVRCAYRDKNVPTRRSISVGFRVAVIPF